MVKLCEELNEVLIFCFGYYSRLAYIYSNGIYYSKLVITAQAKR